MKIKKIYIDNYRRFKEESINFEDDVTIIAGPNNSGKTSFITMFESILGSKKTRFSFSDFPIDVQKNLINQIVDSIRKYHTEEIDEKNFEDNLKKFLKVSSDLRIEIEYFKNDDLSLFSNYFMDLDEKQYKFYFKHSFEINSAKFINILLEKQVVKIFAEEDTTLKLLKNNIIVYLNDCIEENVYYCNNLFSICNSIQLSSFRNLFNIVFIQANRPLDDIDSDTNHGLTSKMVEIIKNGSIWQEEKEKLVRDLNMRMEPVKKIFEGKTLPDIQKHLSDIDKINGAEKTEVALRLNTNDESIEKFIVDIMQAEYDVDGISLHESSQGLGFSNLIYIHLILAKYYQTIDQSKINLVIIEEPESHMHPQMQKNFINHFIEKQTKSCSQAFISTHSNELVKAGKIHRIRVVRKYNNDSFIIELKKIMDYCETAPDEEKEIKDFLTFFFDIGYSEIIFADKAILYEGDTERLYLQSLINKSEEYKMLRKQYISYIQVGGAYGYNYKALIELLKIKTLIITDIDYDKDCVEQKDIFSAEISNATIKNFYKDIEGKDLLSVDELYLWVDSKKNILSDIMYLAFQTGSDSYVRTLEESMLCKCFASEINTTKKRSEWQELKKSSKLLFSIPNNRRGETNSDFTIRDILNSTSSSKVNFMYSVIKEKKYEDLQPSYIKEGLKWLQK